MGIYCTLLFHLAAATSLMCSNLSVPFPSRPNLIYCCSECCSLALKMAFNYMNAAAVSALANPHITPCHLAVNNTIIPLCGGNSRLVIPLCSHQDLLLYRNKCFSKPIWLDQSLSLISSLTLCYRV